MKLRNEKERIVYDLLKEIYPNDKIKCQQRFYLDNVYKQKKYHYDLVKAGRKWKRKFKKCTTKKVYKHITVDFLNITRKIIIEVDNMGHVSPKAKRFDKARDKILNEKGYLVLRLPYDIGFVEGAKRMLNGYKAQERKENE